MRTNRPGNARKLTLGLIFAAALIGLAEVVVRLSGVRSTYQHDGLGQWRVTSDLQQQSFSESQGGHYFRVSTNPDGFRTHSGRERPDGQARIALMGDSTVFGWGVNDDESIAAVAEAELGRMGHDVQVLNLGQPGYSTAMVGGLFQDTVLAYEPDLTIVFIPMHDYNKSLVSDLEFLQGAQTIRGAVRTWMVQNIALYELLRRRLYPLALKPQLLPHEASQEDRVERVSIDERRTVLNQMREAAQAWGGEVSVGLLPLYADLQRGSGAEQSASGLAAVHLTKRPGLEALAAWSDRHQRPVFDLRNCCARGGKDRTFPFDHSHLNALGSREVGVALAEAIGTSAVVLERDL